MINAELGRVFARIADLLEIAGEKPFRINSYRRASRTFSDAGEDLAKLIEQGRLSELPGVGRGLTDRVAQFLQTGHIDILDELEQKLPKGLPDLLEIPGMGPKKVAQVYRELGVVGLDDLSRFVESGELVSLKGFGPTSVRKIADGIAFLESRGGRIPLGKALPVAQALAARLAELRGVHRVEITGSIRRGQETVGDVNLLCEADNGELVIHQFVAFDEVHNVLFVDSTHAAVTVVAEEGHETQVDLRVTSKEAFGAAHQYFTGSKQHNVRLRELAIRRHWRLNEFGLFDGGRSVAGKHERDLYDALGVPWIPPELREDAGEFEHPADIDDLIELEDIRGDLHMHTTASDGKCSIEEMAEAAKTLGYEFIAICDHSRSSTIAHGLSIERMERHIETIRAVNERINDITILVGTECDILPDGSLDYPDDLLAQCDWVVASIHSAMTSGGTGKLSPTDRTLAAMENRYVCTMGHPTGRLIHRRPPMEMDMSAVIQAAARTKTMLEINANWLRLDLKDVHARWAVEAGVTLSINTDAHNTEQFRQMEFGVITARRGGVKASEVVNCRSLAGLQQRIADKRLR